jgi:hypothetical protein
MPTAEELKVYALGSRRVVYAPEGRGEVLRLHLGSRGFRAEVARTPGSPLERLELERHADIGAAQAALDDWPR